MINIKTLAIKCSFLISITAIGIFASCTFQKKSTISGTITGVTGDKIIIMTTALSGKESKTVDTITLKNNQFTYSFKCPELTSVIIFPYKMEDQNSILSYYNDLFYIIPDEHLTVEGRLNNLLVSGNKFYENKNSDLLMSRILSELNEFTFKYNTSVDSTKYIYGVKFDSLILVRQNTAFEYIKNNPDNALSAYYFGYVSEEKIEAAEKIITDNVKKSPYGALIENQKKYSNSFKVKKQKAIPHKLTKGTKAPYFGLPDLSGRTITPDQFRGKFVVLDFWGTWCGWCIKGLPEMKAYYEKYKSQMEIIGIDCRDKEDKWREGVAEYQIPWVNVYNGFDNKILNDYAISGFPTKAVIDQQGNIVQIVVGESPEFYELLDKLMGKK